MKRKREREQDRTIQFEDALSIVGRLVLEAYKAEHMVAAFALLNALTKLGEQVHRTTSEYIPKDVILAIVRGNGKLDRDLADPASEVTPKLFIAGIRQALLGPRVEGARPSFEEMLMKMWAMQRKKGADYGSAEDPLANLKASEAYGIPGWMNTFGRLDDKRFRIISFITKKRLLNESAYDAFRDFAVYAVHMWRLFVEWSLQQALAEQKQEVAADLSTE
jgi:hypothetical protein